MSVATDIITVHLGTNDCAQNYQPATLATKMELLLNHTFEALPTTHVFLASILHMPNFAPKDGQGCAEHYNAMLPAMVAAFAKRGHAITYVPMAEETRLCAAGGDAEAGLCAGGKVHPISAGYLRMASAFALSIAEYGPVA